MDEQAFRPQWQFKFQAHFDKWFGLPQCLKTYHLSLYNIKKDMLLTGPFTMLSMPSFDFHLPPCTEGFLIHLSPLWLLPLWQLPLFPSVAQFPCVGLCSNCVLNLSYNFNSVTGSYEFFFQGLFYDVNFMICVQFLNLAPSTILVRCINPKPVFFSF